MQAAGLLQPSSVFVELGAGKGFLSAWLHQVCGAEDIILLDRLGNFAKKVSKCTQQVLVHCRAYLQSKG
jgi:tRNA A58 N-methylase Trm61